MEDKDKLFSKLIKEYESGNSVMKSYKQNLADARDLYMSKPGAKIENQMANIFVPEFFKAIETLASDIYQILFSDDPFFITIGREPSDDVNASMMSGLMEYYTDKMKFKNQFIEIIRTYLIYGVVFVKVCWKYDKNRIIKKGKAIQPDGSMIVGEVEKDEVVYDAPELIMCSMFDIVVNPKAKSIDDAEWIYERSRMSWSQLDRMRKQGLIGDFEMPEEDKGSASPNEDDNLKDRSLEDLGFSDIGSKDEYEIVQRYGFLKKQDIYPELEGKDEGKEEVQARVIFCTTTHKVLSVSENPYWHKKKPYVACTMFKLDNSIFGINLANISESVQAELNTLHNQILDYGTFSIYNMWLRDRNSGIKKTDLKAKPNRIIDTDNMAGLREIQPSPSAVIQGMNMEMSSREDIKQTTGALSSLQGVPVSKRQTKAEIQYLVGQGSGRVRNYALNLAENLVKPLLTMMYQLIQQYVDKPQVIRIIGQNGVDYQTVTPDKIEGNFDFIPKIMTDYVNRVTIRENMMEFLGIASKIPNFPPDSIYKLVKKIYELFGNKDANEIFATNQIAMPINSNIPGGQVNQAPSQPVELDEEQQKLAEDVLDKLGV